jgi:alkylation response protein AidB-like acyl-CoA dehydrogenase
MWRALSPELLAWKETCRAFAREVIAPQAARWDRENAHPAPVVAEARARGLVDVAFPVELGGRGLSLLHVAVGGEELAAACAPTAFVLGFNHGALRPIVRAGTPEQRQAFVRDLLRRGGHASLCLTEEGASGSNLLQVKTLARETAGGWVLSGEKCMVGNGTVSELYLVLAETEDARGRRRGPSFFAVPRGPGVEVGENTDKLGFRCVTTPTVRFREVALGSEHLIGGAGQAEAVLLDTLDFIRFGGAAVILGIVVGGLRELVPWLEERRVAPDDPLVTKGDVQQELGQLLAEVQAVRGLMWRAAGLLDQGQECAVETASAKLLASELAVRATGQFAQWLGWRGVDAAWPAQKRLRDARATTIYEGTSQVQRLNLARALRRSVHGDGWL